jgi:uncharacterized protein
MQTSESLRVLLFVGIVTLVYIHAIGATIRLLRKKPRTFDGISLILAVLGFICIGYGYFIEPNRLSKTRVVIQSSKIPQGASPIRIVHLSDLHSDPKPRLEPSLPEAVATERPDVIVFTGDAINSREAVPVFKIAMTALSKIAPTFVVRGNWDSSFGTDINLYGGTGVHELDGTAARMEIRGIPIWISGLAAGNETELEKALSGIPSGEANVFLYHYPDLIADVVGKKVDLYCAGHTHGGQVALPLYGALITLSKFGKRYEAGLYREQDTWLYVNRGIGMEAS